MIALGSGDRRPGRLRVDALARMLCDADYEVELAAVPAGESRREAMEGEAR
ncbi:hypothetical protein [Actinomadura roseirufa]|uniref:hypothetical protein n=1 Tax=Actinomadura roseirufa TaxID=2094049 RepID=UPI0013F17C37|nr:hypothetical protein [Actinomadura roseirufa]